MRCTYCTCLENTTATETPTGCRLRPTTATTCQTGLADFVLTPETINDQIEDPDQQVSQIFTPSVRGVAFETICLTLYQWLIIEQAKGCQLGGLRYD